MNGHVIGALAGVVLAAFGLAFGFGGLLIAALLGGIGALVGGIATGRLDMRAAADAARDRTRG